MPARFLGITPPISVAESSAREQEITVSLMEELRRQNNFETEEEAKNRCVINLPGRVPTELMHRELVLGRITALTKRFVKEVSLMEGLSETAANAAGGKIFTFGSYRLGVHSPGSDIDTLLVVPKHVSREHFFDVFEKILRETEGVSEVAVSCCVALREGGFGGNTPLYRAFLRRTCLSSPP
jgi:poly(A) polymerase